MQLGEKMWEKSIRFLQLTGMPGFGTVNQNRLLKLCGGIDACFGMSEDEMISLDRKLKKCDRIGDKRIRIFVAARCRKEEVERAMKLYDTCMKTGIEVITVEDADYPRRFNQIPGMPSVIYTKGNLRINGFKRSVGIVGARRCSAEGKQKAIEMTESELMRGAAIISGMAKGIDSYAHTAVIKNSGYTIAVLGSGADVCYPKEHDRLYEEIAEHGCILSEYPPETQPREYMFPQRNRLIAALSDVLYVIDAGSHSGTETTVAYGQQFGRCVFRL